MWSLPIREGSHLLFLKPNWSKICLRLSNHCLGACLRPYKALRSLHTRVGSEASKPWGCVIYTTSSKKPFKKALLTSSWSSSHFRVSARVRIIRMVTGFITEEKVSLKSKPCTWWKHFATKLALYLFREPSAFSLILPQSSYVRRHPRTLEWIALDNDDCSHEKSIWSCDSHTRCSSLMWLANQSCSLRNLGGIRGQTRLWWRRWALIIGSTCCRHKRKFISSNRSTMVSENDTRPWSAV